MIDDIGTLIERLDKAPDWTHISVQTKVLKQLIDGYEKERLELLQVVNQGQACIAHKPMTEGL